ncbi:MAG: putative SCO1/SenC family protein [Gemmatimonadetes bacterium]|nr:putative SCO1/SenC family protein [Gemmatimonadota bacterium]
MAETETGSAAERRSAAVTWLRRVRVVLVAGIVAALAVLGVTALRTRAVPTFHGTAYDPAPAPALALHGVDGRPASLADFRGRPVFVYFGYTHCPDVCPLTLSRLVAALAAAGKDGKEARILFVTVDPARDTPAVLAEYARRMGPQVVALTGDSASIERAKAGYGAYVVPMPHGVHGGMGHSSAVYGIDRQGRLRVLIGDSATRDEIGGDVRTLVGI